MAKINKSAAELVGNTPLLEVTKYQASVAQIMQKESKRPDTAEVVVITKLVSEGAFFKVKEELENSASVRKISSMIRVYEK